jgi:hypothetical protein
MRVWLYQSSQAMVSSLALVGQNQAIALDFNDIKL